MQLIFSTIVDENTHSPGVCYVRKWPMLTTDDINVYTDDGCAITKYPVRTDGTYTTAILFTLDKINSSCQQISCLTPFKKEVKHFIISKLIHGYIFGIARSLCR